MCDPRHESGLNHVAIAEGYHYLAALLSLQVLRYPNFRGLMQRLVILRQPPCAQTILTQFARMLLEVSKPMPDKRIDDIDEEMSAEELKGVSGGQKGAGGESGLKSSTSEFNQKLLGVSSFVMSLDGGN